MGMRITPIICAKETQQYCDITDDRCCTGQGRRISTVNRDKRASLSSGLLASKDAAPATGDGTSSAGTAASSDTAAKAESRANVLYTKGAASASGFRPDQWSFDSPAGAAPAPAPEPPRLVMPFPAKAVAAPAVVPPPRVAPGRKLMLGAAAIAVTASVALGFALLARPPQHAAAPIAAPRAAPSTPSVIQTAPVTMPPAAVAVPDSVSADEIAALKARADQLVATGDIVAARGFYERAAEHGDAAAMTAAGKTYDPLFLDEMRVRGSRGDAGKAAEWYRRAGAAGDAEAAQRLKRLIARYAG